MEGWRAGATVDRDDSGLVRRCLAGDQGACTTLVEGHARLVGTVIWRATGDAAVVEDLAQETFLRVFRGLQTFSARAKLPTWIYTVAHRVAVDHMRRNRREPPVADDLVPVVDPLMAAAREETARLIHQGLVQLPEQYRLALVYTAIEGLDYETVAAMLGVPTGTVKTLVFRGKRLLKDRIVAALGAHTEGSR